MSIRKGNGTKMKSIEQALNEYIEWARENELKVNDNRNLRYYLKQQKQQGIIDY